MARESWQRPPGRLELPGGDVHVWRAPLELAQSVLESLERALSPDERDRAARFRRPQDRRRFMAARGILRDILSRYLDEDPAALRFSASSSGKPALEHPSGLRFNLSHSHGLALYAVAANREAGVDVEMIRTDLSTDRIAGRFFSLAEMSALQALSEAERIEAFFRCWTRKEAYIKARGEGLRIPLGSFDVSLSPGEPARLLAVRDDPSEAERWRLESLETAPGYIAAVAVEGAGWRLRLWDWTP